jgi:lysophospholipase L1-like esterase
MKRAFFDKHKREELNNYKILMKNTMIIAFLFLFVAVACTREKPKILIIGDSISIGYTPFVQAYFEGRAVVAHNPGNAQHTRTGLKNIKDWTGEEDWDIIQMNWGLWDLCYRNPELSVAGKKDKIKGKLTCSVKEYSDNLDSLIAFLRQETNAKLVFVTTTYVPEDEPGRFSADVLKYNEAAKKMAQKYDVAVNDIYLPSVEIHKKYGNGRDDVHYSEEGYRALGKLIGSFLDEKIK